VRVLIIGGTGFSGPHVVHRLMDMGHEIALFHRGQTEADLPAGVQHILGDRKHLGNFADELRRFAPQTVLDMIPATAQDAWSIMSVFKGLARRVIALSSQDVYRAYGKLIGIESGPVESIPLTEDAPLRQKLYPYRDRVEGPDQPGYHYEKILVEQVMMSDPDLPGTILRLPMVYGPRDRQHRLFEYLKRMDDNRPAILLDEGLANWRWTRGYVENVAAAIALAVTDERATGRVYNVGETEALTTADWIRTIGRVAGWKGQVVGFPQDRLPAHLEVNLNTDQHLVTDSTRIRQELGYDEIVPQDEALKRTVAWERTLPPDEIDPQQFDYAAEDAALAALKAHNGSPVVNDRS
jgi:nucleoside-diphosphate-sugar epimerase